MPGPSDPLRDPQQPPPQQPVQQLAQLPSRQPSEQPSEQPSGPRTVVVTRRGALTGLVATGGLVLTGCTEDPDGVRRRGRRLRRGQQAEGATDRKPSDQDPDIAVAAEALAGERAALDAVQATLQQHAALTDLLTPVRDAHQAHADLLAEAVPDQQPTTEPSSPSPGKPPSSSAAASPSEAPSADGSPADGSAADLSGASIPVPRSRRAALRRLARAETELSTGQKQRAFAAQSGAFARLLASMSASAGQYAVVLDPANQTSAGGDAEAGS